jgi:exopolysaccharide biosynthesis protein
MKKTALPNLMRRAAALTLAVLLAVPTVYAAAGEEKLQTSSELVEGLTYRNTVTVNNSSRVESFSMELEPESQAYPILLQASGTVYGAATINKAVSYAQELGYHVLGAINTDFFSTSSGVPIGIVIEDGIYKSSPENEHAMAIVDGQVLLVESPKVAITLQNQRSGQTVSPHHLNKLRSESGGLYLYNQDFSTVSTRTSTSGWYVRMKLVQGNPDDPMGIWGIQEEQEGPEGLTVNSTFTLEVTELIKSSEPITIGADEYILSAADASGYGEVYQSFAVGDQITLTTSCQDENLSQCQWAGGVGDIMIRDGKMTDSSGWTYVKDGRAPRTALGVKEDGTLVVYAVDGRQSGYSIGLSQVDLADEMLRQGCQWAVNLDGGGSTAISVWVPGQSGPAIRNIPSDGRARSCATYLLLVTDEAGDGQADRLAMKEDGLVVLTGSSVTLPETVAVDSGLNLLNESLDDLRITSTEELGEIEDGVYTAGNRAGTDTLRLRSRDLDVEGTAQIHVVDTLTSLTISREGSSTALSSLTVKPGETVQLAVTGSYWNRTALRDWGPVTWSVEGEIGTVDENGLFTAGKGGSGSITATAGGLRQTISVSFTNVHTDVTEDHWSYEAVEYCYSHGIVGGISATEFGRDYQIRRGDFMLMLYGAVGKPKVTTGCSFSDVSPNDYYYTALAWGQSVGLASGTGDGAYSPTAPITREQAFTILRQAMPLLGKECPDASLTVLDAFSDKDQIADYAKGHTATLVAQGIVSGKGTGVDPKGNLTRAEMAALLYQIMTYTPITDVPTDPVEPEQPVDPEQPVEPENPENPEEPEQPVEPEQPEEPDNPGESQEVDPSQYTLTLNLSEVTLASGESRQLLAALDPELEGAEITWSSDSPATAAVSAEGVVTNLFPGSGTAAATITASWNGRTASCMVYCQQAQLTGTVVDAQAGLNVRSGPGTDNAVVGGLNNGTRVVVLKVEDGWCQVMYLNKSNQAAIGYVSSDYIQLNQSAQQQAPAA